MKKLVVAIVVIVLIAIGALAFGSNDKFSNNTAQSSQNQPSQSASQSVSTDKVEIEDIAFSPSTITIKKGTTVTWTNSDNVGHTITQDDGTPAGSPGLDSKVLNKGESYKATFNSTGTYHYHCSIHTQMTGTVMVTQ